MCGRYTLINTDELSERFNTLNKVELRANYNITPGNQIPVVTKNSPNTLVLMRWGLIPFWAKDENIGYGLINARAEGIKDKASFRKPIRQQRCLVPANGFYEWSSEKSQKVKKTPYYATLKGHGLFAMAGIYDIWKDKNNEDVLSYSIITTKADKKLNNIHNRMPVIISKQNESLWLNKKTELAEIISLLIPLEPSKMNIYRVSTLVNNPGNNNPDLVKKI